MTALPTVESIPKSRLFSWASLVEKVPGLDQDFGLLSSFELLFARQAIMDSASDEINLADLATVDLVNPADTEGYWEIYFSFTDLDHRDLEDVQTIKDDEALFLIGRNIVEIISLDEVEIK